MTARFASDRVAPDVWPLHHRVAAAALHAAPVALAVAVGCAVGGERLATSSALVAFAAVAASSVFLLDARGAGPVEVLLRAVVAAGLSGTAGVVAAAWAYALASGGPLHAYQAALAGQGPDLRGVLQALWWSLAGAGVAAPVLAVRAQGGGLAALLGASAATVALAAVAAALVARPCTREDVAALAAVTVAAGLGAASLLTCLVDWLCAAAGVADPRPRPPTPPALASWAVLAAGVVLAMSAVGWDRMRFHCCMRPENSAISTLKNISTCQSMFREQGKEGPSPYAASLAELAPALRAPWLATGIDTGYRFRVVASADGLCWAAVATPVEVRFHSQRSFLINQTGTIYATEATDPLVIELPACAAPPGMRQIAPPPGSR